ncbi:hypothetical protein ACET3Z_031198 [Daucus carota]
MTNKIEGQNNNQSQSIWTTWEDLLLSSAVRRYGLSDWSTVATELQSRVNNNQFTPQFCADKFSDLKRRFDVSGDGENVAGDGENVAVPWLDELKNLRIKELKEIVQGRGVSIQSLNLKVKRLEEERERSGKEDGSDKQKPDLEAERSENVQNDENDVVMAEKDEKIGEVAGDSVSGDRSERENRSVNESNSTEKKRMETGPVRTGGDKPVGPVQADSWNDSSKPSDEKKAENESVKVVESAGGESKGGKDSNEAQSSASLTRKSRSSTSNSGGGDERMTSKTTSRDSVKNTEQLNRFLNSIRSSKNGPVFEARLQSQKTEKYNSIIRQHVDLETIQSRVNNGSYSSCTTKFYLDLLLLFNNAIVFYPKSSPESTAAVDLRKFVLKGLNKKRGAKQSNPSPESGPTTLLKIKSDPERSDSLLAKQKNSAPFIVCRKRSSITSKPSASNKPQKPEDKQALDTKQPPARPSSSAKPSSSSPNEEESLLKLNPKEKPVTGARSMRRSSSARINNASAKNTANTTVKTPLTSPSMNPGSSTAKGSEGSKADNKKKTNPLLVKKREAADFLKRIKKSSPAKGTLLDTLKNLPENSNSSSKRETREQPKKKVVDERKESTRGRQKGRGGGKRAKEEEASQSKRNVGRPPKRGRDDGVASGKRGKEIVEEEVVAKRPNKRSKR